MFSLSNDKHRTLLVSSLTILRPTGTVVGFISLPRGRLCDGETRLLGAQVRLCGMTTCVVCSVMRESSAPCGKELGLGSCVTVPEEPPATPSS